MIVFLGLGNVGSEYDRTKHNLGFWVVDELAQRWNLTFRPGKGDYIYAECSFPEGFVSVGGDPSERIHMPERTSQLVLAKPTFGMNRSGIPVREIKEFWSLSLSDLYVIVDDVDLPLGAIRIRPRGGDGCHRGMESIIYSLGSTHFPRIRIGIGTEEQMRPAEHYVLKPFRKKDESLALEMVKRGADAVESILSVGLESTMSRFNRP